MLINEKVERFSIGYWGAHSHSPLIVQPTTSLLYSALASSSVLAGMAFFRGVVKTSASPASGSAAPDSRVSLLLARQAQAFRLSPGPICNMSGVRRWLALV